MLILTIPIALEHQFTLGEPFVWVPKLPDSFWVIGQMLRKLIQRHGAYFSLKQPQMKILNALLGLEHLIW